MYAIKKYFKKLFTYILQDSFTLSDLYYLILTKYNDSIFNKYTNA